VAYKRNWCTNSLVDLNGLVQRGVGGRVLFSSCKVKAGLTLVGVFQERSTLTY
jgi:hypothetical protein